MSRWRCVVFSMIAVAFLLVAVPDLDAETVRVVSEQVEVRREANAGANVLGTVSKGTVLQVLGRQGGWVNVAYPIAGGAFYSGYIPAVFCEDARGAAPSTLAAPPVSRPAPAPAPVVAPAPAPVVAPAPAAPAPQTQPVAAPPQTYAPPPTSPTPAQARYDVADSPQREGFWIGLGLGYGSQKGCDDFFGCGDREGGLSGHIKLGGTLNPQLLLGVESVGWAKDIEGTTVTVGGLMGTVTVYPVVSSGFFVKGGVGLTYWKIAEGSISVDTTGWGFTGGLGYDLRVGRNISITPAFAYLYGSVGDLDEFGLTGLHGDLFQFTIGVTFH